MIFSAAMGMALDAAQAAALGPTLDVALRRIASDYPKLAAMRQEIASAAGKAREKRGAFDPVVLLNYDAQRYNSPSDPGKGTDFTAASGTVQWTTLAGTSYFVGSRLNSGKPKSPLNATGDLGEHFAGVKFPLLRDFGLNEKSVALRQAELAVPYAERNVAAFRLGVLRDGAAAYWEWAAAGERLTIADGLLRNARVREDAVRRRFEAGDEREMSLVEARGETRRREGAAAKAERDLQKAAIKLGLYLGGPPGIPPRLPPPTPPADLDAQAQRAEAARPEIAALESLRQIVLLDRRLADNLRRPALDLTLAAGVDAGDKGIGPTPRLSLLYSVPLRQNAADGRRDDAEAKLRKIDLDRAFLVQSVRAEVADAVSAVRASLERIEAARAEQAQARRLLAMEQKGFDLGEGTLFLLNQRERAAAEADARLVDVLAEYHQAIAALRAATADL